MRKIFPVIIIFFLLSGCASQQKEHWKSEAIHKIEAVELPAWFYELPKMDGCVIGISQKSFNVEDMKESARQMAAVMKSRNEASYSIDKFASTTSENIIEEGKAKFRLNVSASPEVTKRIYDSLQLIDEAYFYDFFIGLYSLNANEIPKEYKRKYVANLPDWYEEDAIIIEPDRILSRSSYSSSNLLSAWENAAEKARFEIAKYMEKEVQSALISDDERIEKKISLETRKKLIRMEMTRSFVSSELKDNLRSYKVIMEIMIKI